MKADVRVPVKLGIVQMRGGLDESTPTQLAPGGIARVARNFECAVSGGYTRVKGYERVSGQPRPSLARARVFGIAGSVPSIGATVTAGVSSGVVAAASSTYVVLTGESADFVIGDVLYVGATPYGTLTAPPSMTTKQYAQFKAAAANVYRALINPITGSGPVWGVFMLGATYYAIRNNAGGTAADLWKSTSSGWTQVTLPQEVAFTGGSGTAPAEGATITKGAVTATVKRVVTETGTWAGANATGRFIITSASGTFSAGALTAGATATLSGAQSDVTIPPDGHLHTIKANFYGQLVSQRIYGVTGVGRAFEFDGTTLVPISTGAGANDKPAYVAQHLSRLALAVGGSLVLSVAGNPYCYDTTLYAAELATGDEITGLVAAQGSETTEALTVFCRNSIRILYGTGVNGDWLLSSYSDNTGALAHTAQIMADTVALDDRGVVMLSATMAYGNFVQATLTANLNKFIQAHKSRASCSAINRSKSQYRVFFSDGNGLYLTLLNGKFLGAMPVRFPEAISCAWFGEDDAGDEVTLLGGETNGHVYMLDSGTSFDGEAIQASMTLNFDALGSARLLKRFRKASSEVMTNGYVEFQFGYKLGYGTSDINQPGYDAYTVSGDMPLWGSFTWGSFTWGGSSALPAEIGMVGTAENVQAAFRCNADYIDSFTVTSLIYQYSNRRLMR